MRTKFDTAAAGSIRLGERGGVRRDDEIVGESAFESETRYAERLVLIVAGPIGEREGRLRDAPRHASFLAVLDLPANAGATTLIEQRAWIAAQQQLRHQVLEHRSAPRHEGGSTVDARHQASEMEPVMLRDVAFCDRDETREPRFRCQQVVERCVETARAVGVGETIADRENSPTAIVEKIESHTCRDRRRALGKTNRARRMASLQMVC